MSDTRTARLAEIRARRRAASPGPWLMIDTMTYGDPVEGPGKNCLVGAPRDPEAKPYPTDSSERILSWDYPIENDANVRFIQHAPEDIDWLLAELDAARRTTLLEAADDIESHYVGMWTTGEVIAKLRRRAEEKQL